MHIYKCLPGCRTPRQRCATRSQSRQTLWTAPSPRSGSRRLRLSSTSTCPTESGGIAPRSRRGWRCRDRCASRGRSPLLLNLAEVPLLLRDLPLSTFVWVGSAFNDRGQDLAIKFTNSNLFPISTKSRRNVLFSFV